MTLFKLSLRNARRQAGDYLIYFITIVLVCAMLYAFNALIFSPEIHELSDLLDNLTLVIILASIVVVLIIGWLVSYTTGFMLSRRSRELGTYLLIGLENWQAARLFLLENLAVGGVSLLFGIPLGSLIFQVLRAVLLAMFSVPYTFSFSFSLRAAGLTLLYFAAIFLSALRRSRRRICKMNIYSLLYFERQNEMEILKNSRTRKVIFSFSIVLGTAGLLLLATRMLPLGILGAGCIIAFLYGFFTSFSSGVPAFFERNPSRKFRGQNLLIFRSLSSKLAAMGIVMATAALLFTATLFTEGAGMVFHGIFENRTEKNSFDLLFISDNESHTDQCLEYIEKSIPLSALHPYRLYQGADSGILEYLEKNAGYLRYDYSHEYNGGILMAYSDYAALREMLGLPAAELEPGRFLIHCMSYLEKPLSQWEQPLSLDGGSLLPGSIYTEQFLQNLWNGNGHQFLLVVPDEACTSCPVIRFALAAMTREAVTKKQFYALARALSNPAADGITSAVDEWDLLYSKSIARAEAASWSAMTVFPLFYLALTLALAAATVLTVQQLSDAGRFRRQFELLRKLGMDSREMKRTLFRQSAIYYAMPVIPPVLTAIPFILDLADAVEPGTMTGASSPPAVVALSLGLFFLIYLIYAAAAYTSMKQNVLPE